MTRSEMIRAVEAEIRRLEAIRDQLRMLAGPGVPGRQRRLSEEGRRRIAEAQHRRWANARAANAREQRGALSQG